MYSSAIAIPETDHSTAERYESLIRIATSIRAQRDPGELFGVLVHELGQVLQFDAIAQFDEWSAKVAIHLGPGCLDTEHCPGEIAKEETVAAWVYEHQETLVLGTLDGERRFPAVDAHHAEGRAAIGVCVSANHGAPPAGQPGDCQRASRRLYTGRGSILQYGGRPDRAGHGRRHQLPCFAAIAGTPATTTGSDQPGGFEPESARCAERDFGEHPPGNGVRRRRHYAAESRGRKAAHLRAGFSRQPGTY